MALRPITDADLTPLPSAARPQISLPTVRLPSYSPANPTKAQEVPQPDFWEYVKKNAAATWNDLNAAGILGSIIAGRGATMLAAPALAAMGVVAGPWTLLGIGAGAALGAATGANFLFPQSPEEKAHSAKLRGDAQAVAPHSMAGRIAADTLSLAPELALAFAPGGLATRMAAGNFTQGVVARTAGLTDDAATGLPKTALAERVRQSYMAKGQMPASIAGQNVGRPIATAIAIKGGEHVLPVVGAFTLGGQYMRHEPSEILADALTGFGVGVGGGFAPYGMKTVAEAGALLTASNFFHDEDITPETVTHALGMLISLKVGGKVLGTSVTKSAPWLTSKFRATFEPYGLSEAKVEEIISKLEPIAEEYVRRATDDPKSMRELWGEIPDSFKKVLRDIRNIDPAIKKGVFARWDEVMETTLKRFEESAERGIAPGEAKELIQRAARESEEVVRAQRRPERLPLGQRRTLRQAFRKEPWRQEKFSGKVNSYLGLAELANDVTNQVGSWVANTIVKNRMTRNSAMLSTLKKRETSNKDSVKRAEEELTLYDSGVRRTIYTRSGLETNLTLAKETLAETQRAIARTMSRMKKTETLEKSIRDDPLVLSYLIRTSIGMRRYRDFLRRVDEDNLLIKARMRPKNSYTYDEVRDLYAETVSKGEFPMLRDKATKEQIEGFARTELYENVNNTYRRRLDQAESYERMVTETAYDYLHVNREVLDVNSTTFKGIPKAQVWLQKFLDAEANGTLGDLIMEAVASKGKGYSQFRIGLARRLGRLRGTPEGDLVVRRSVGPQELEDLLNNRGAIVDGALTTSMRGFYAPSDRVVVEFTVPQSHVLGFVLGRNRVIFTSEGLYDRFRVLDAFRPKDTFQVFDAARRAKVSLMDSVSKKLTDVMDMPKLFRKIRDPGEKIEMEELMGVELPGVPRVHAMFETLEEMSKRFRGTPFHMVSEWYDLLSGRGTDWSSGMQGVRTGIFSMAMEAKKVFTNLPKAEQQRVIFVMRRVIADADKEFPTGRTVADPKSGATIQEMVKGRDYFNIETPEGRANVIRLFGGEDTQAFRAYEHHDRFYRYMLDKDAVPAEWIPHDFRGARVSMKQVMEDYIMRVYKDQPIERDRKLRQMEEGIAQALKQPYFPAMRHGKWAVFIGTERPSRIGADGKTREYTGEPRLKAGFRMFETEAEARQFLNNFNSLMRRKKANPTEEVRMEGISNDARGDPAPLEITADLKANLSRYDEAKRSYLTMPPIMAEMIKDMLDKHLLTLDRQINALRPVVETLGPSGPKSRRGKRLESLELERKQLEGRIEGIKEIVDDAAVYGGFRQRLMREEKVPGFVVDPGRDVTWYGFYGANYLSRMKFNHLLLEKVNEFHSLVKQAMDKGYFETEINGRKGRIRIQDVTQMEGTMAYLSRAMKHMAEPMTEMTKVKAIAFYWYFAAMPKMLMQNVTQLLVTGAWQSARYGDRQSAKAMAAAFSDAMLFTMGKKLKGARPLDGPLTEAIIRSQHFGFTLESLASEVASAHSRSNVRPGLLETIAPERKMARWFMGATDKMVLPFSASEKLNRYVTFISTWRLEGHRMWLEAKEQGYRGDYNTYMREAPRHVRDQLFDAAREGVVRTQLEYANWNRPELWRNKYADVALIFRMFSRGMMHFFKNDPGSMRALVAFGMLAGVMGLPFAEDMVNATQAVMQRAFPQKKVNLELLMHEVAEELNINGEALLHGMGRTGVGPWFMSLFNTLGFDVDVSYDRYRGLLGFGDWSGSLSFGMQIPGMEYISDLVGMGGLKDDWERSLISAQAAAMGPAVAPAYNLTKMLLSGDIFSYRSWEGVMPPFLRNAMKAVRYQDYFNVSGVTKMSQGREETRKGHLVAEVDGRDLVALAMGFPPVEVQRGWERRGWQIETQKYLVALRSNVINKIDQGNRLSDIELFREGLRDWGDYNKINQRDPWLMISPKTISQSLKTRGMGRILSSLGLPSQKMMIPMFMEINQQMQTGLKIESGGPTK